MFRPRCKLWGCPSCAETNRKLWAARATFGAGKLVESGAILNFVTLTSHEKLGPYQTLAVWPEAWKRLHARATYTGGKQPYLMIPEQHKNGRLHMHALALWPMTTRWWKDNARAVGMGYIAEAENVKSAGLAGWYVTKYLTKSLSSMNWPTRFRRIRTSRDWPRLPTQETRGEWSFSPMPKSEELVARIDTERRKGRKVFVLPHDDAWGIIAAIDNEGEMTPDD